MTLQGKTLALALLGAAGAGVVAGVTIEGWRKARGLPPIVSVDAGVSVAADAGTSSKADCAATIEHWNVQYIPGPVRYLPAPDGGLIQRQTEPTVILVPDVRLSGTTSSSAIGGASAEASTSVRVDAPRAEPERHWEVGPSALYGFSSQQVLWGAQGGWNGGPFDIRAQVLKGPGDVYAGVMLGWRF